MSARPRAIIPCSQDEINALLVREARQGHRVVRLKSGDPLIFGRAGEEMAALRAAGISFDIVPGITAALAAAAETEIPLTLRESSSALVFATGHDADGETLPGWAGLALDGATVAVYMGRSVAGQGRRAPDRGRHEAPRRRSPSSRTPRGADRRAYAGRLDELARSPRAPNITGPVLFIIGDVVAAGAIAADARGARRTRRLRRDEMFKAAKAGPRKAITANRLDDGLVVFLDETGDWPLRSTSAHLFNDGPELDAATAYAKAQHDARIIVEPYADRHRRWSTAGCCRPASASASAPLGPDDRLRRGRIHRSDRAHDRRRGGGIGRDRCIATTSSTRSSSTSGSPSSATRSSAACRAS